MSSPDRPASLYSVDDQGVRVERVIALSRVLLAAAALAATAAGPPEPLAPAWPVLGLLTVYAALGAAVLLVHGNIRTSRVPLHLLTHTGDLCAAALLLVLAGPSGPGFVFLVFGTLTATYRWGSRGTLATTAINVAWLGALASLGYASLDAEPGVVPRELETHWVFLEASSLSVMGLFLAYISDVRQPPRIEASQVAAVRHRMRVQARAHERARLGRELHDGVVQSLIAAQMHVDVLRRQALKEAPQLVEGLFSVETLLRDEVLGLRDLTQCMRSLDVVPAHALEHLTEIVERFERETGIRARFVTNVDRLPLSRRGCRELSLIVLEGLANIRKHSGARHVLVRLTASHGSWTLSIEDDGRGFPSSGCRSHGQLDAARRGPAAIQEHVSALRGVLTLDSRPGQGTRLEIAFR